MEATTGGRSQRHRRRRTHTSMRIRHNPPRQSGRGLPVHHTIRTISRASQCDRTAEHNHSSPDDVTSGQLRTLRISNSRARVRKLSEAVTSLDRIIALGQSGLLARVGSTKIRTALGCALAERYALPMRIVLPASCPPRKSPFDRDSRNRRGSTPLHSSLDPRPTVAGPKSLSRSLAG